MIFNDPPLNAPLFKMQKLDSSPWALWLSSLPNELRKMLFMWSITQIANVAAVNLTSSNGQVIYSANYTSKGGTLHVTGFCSFYSSAATLKNVFNVIVGTVVQQEVFYINNANTHIMLPFDVVVTGLSSGSHTIELVNADSSNQIITDGQDRCTMVIQEFPF